MGLKEALERRAAKRRLRAAKSRLVEEVQRYNAAVDEGADGYGLGLVTSGIIFAQGLCEEAGVPKNEIAEIKATMHKL